MLEEEPHQRTVGARIFRMVIWLLIAAAIATTVGWWYVHGKDRPVVTAAVADTDTLARAPAGARVRVRVVNTTNVDGLAKRATAVLRDHGFDVVDYDADKKTLRDTTLIETNSGHADWSDRVWRVLGAGAITSRPDSSRYVDVTVFIGRDWKAPPQSFRP